MMHALVRGGGAGEAAPGASISRDGAGEECPHNRMAAAATAAEERSGGAQRRRHDGHSGPDERERRFACVLGPGGLVWALACIGGVP